ncbi:hypothetical protein [Chromobacterium sp. IIBBL 290-4]|uniref:hypothetical protein n=1 Tax=Chromobacterium sp. IIBBL 290-4 TaxID=2953890 RepID=UPI0020B684B4|nr:hypothetical protein [Chromobacterium sp. IIBBL 290-4]UTH76209.1 hypothetical protein NKT35_08955 [Chromobacterium sp. IIBBL 290-4]
MLLLLKLCLVPTLIWLITLAAKKWGPGVAGALAGFPVITGSILLILSLEQTPAFVREASLAASLGTSANLVFGIAYSWAALRWRWLPCLLLGLAAYALAVALGHWAQPSGWQSAVAGLLFLPLAGRLFPAPPVARDQPPRNAGMAPRMLAGAALALIITSLSARLGPSLSGLLAVFPVLGSVLAVFSHLSAGPAATIKLLRGMVRGFYAFVAFCIALAAALNAWPAPAAFSAALALAISVQMLMMWLGRRHH